MRRLDIPEALTFSDVSLRARYSQVLPDQAVIKTLFSRNVSLNIPFSSAAMDTVTGAPFAIKIAQLGGIGVVHKNNTPEEQAGEVDKVKRSESGMIVSPYTITRDRPISEALGLMGRYHISGIPVVDSQNRLVGIVTNRDLRFETNHSKKVGEVMTRKNLITAPVGTTLDRAKQIFRRRKVEKLPVVDKRGRLRGLITVKDIQKLIAYPNAAKDKLGRLRVAAAVGASGDFFERAAELVKAGVDVLVVDTAHGHSRGVLSAIRKIKRRFPEIDVVGGNIADADAARALIKAGADAIKIGMGPGSICTTRLVAGIGVPQITAILDCASIARRYKVPLIADGGIEYSGDVVKAIAAGADSVMIGSQFAGTDETPGDVVLYQGRSFKSYRGMGSEAAMQKGSADRYGQQGRAPNKLVAEGVEGLVAHRGPLAMIMDQFTGGLRQGMGYLGCRDINALKRQRDRFVRVSAGGLRESHVHGVIVTKEPSNYRVS